MGYDANVIEVLESTDIEIPTEENVIAFETEPSKPSKFRILVHFVAKYGVFVFWLGILFIMVMALGSAATSHNELRYDCDCFNFTDFCQNCRNGSWFSVPLGQD